MRYFTKNPDGSYSPNAATDQSAQAASACEFARQHGPVQLEHFDQKMTLTNRHTPQDVIAFLRIAQRSAR